MEGVPSSRGRGIKPAGATQRPTSRNKQWIAPGRERNGGDGERWERGGGPWRGGASRGRGRGLSSRGSGLSFSRPILQVGVPTPQGHGANGAEDEAMTDGEGSVQGEEAQEEKEAETQEDRDRFYQELVKARELERKKAIAEGKMDDPNVPKRLDEAITIVGTCMDMCPRFERYQRERQHQLDKWELIPGTRRVDHKRAVKRYERAAGDKVLPSDLRPPTVLKKTLDYLFHDLIPRGGFKETSFFVRDRTRQVRNDCTIQHETGPVAIECHERCARFHVLSMHLMRGHPDFDFKLEEQALMNTLQSLKEFWDDRRGDFPFPNEFEMRVYHRLIHIRDTTDRRDNVPHDITSHPVFQLTSQFRLHVQAKSAPIRKNSTLVVDAEGMQIFGQLAASLREHTNPIMTYLVACIMEGIFGKGTIDDIEAIRGDLSIQDVIDGNHEPFVNTVSEDQDYYSSDEHPLVDELHDDQPVDSWSSATAFAVPTPATTPAITALPSASGPSSASIPIKSAFSTIVSTPNAFGNPTTAFGGSAFGITFPSATRKSVLGEPATSSALVTAHSPSSPAFPTSSQSNGFSKSTASSSGDFAQSVDSTQIFGTPAPSGLSGVSERPISTAPSLFASTAVTANFDLSTQIAGSPTPLVSTLNPTAPSFTPPSVSSPNGKHVVPMSSAPLLGTTVPTAPSSPTSHLGSVPHPLTTVPTLPLSAFSAPQRSQNAAPGTNSDPRIVERRQTLWDLPSTTPASIADIRSLFTPPGSGSAGPHSPVEPPPLHKPPPLSLPPTPTSRWFDPSSGLKSQDPSLVLRKQSLGLVALQIPDFPSPGETLSPLALATPKSGITHANDEDSPTVISAVASSSRVLLDVDFTKTIASPTKGKAKDTGDHLKTLALNFARRSSSVRGCYNLWKKRTADRVAWAEACRRSDAYKDKVHQHRLSSSLSSLPNAQPDASRKRRPSTVRSPEHPRRKGPRRSTGQYRAPITDDELVKRLKENHEEQQKRWAQGSFLQAVRGKLKNKATNPEYPTEWCIWLSLNGEIDSTAIWLQHKFGAQDAGNWLSQSVFSLPVTESSHSSTGSPGLIVFERTPLDGLDLLEKKYTILDDCSRLRDVAEQLHSHPKLRFTPALLVITWADDDGIDVTSDFGDMIQEMIQENLIGSAQNLIISSVSADWDNKFLEAINRTELDVFDKTKVNLEWRELWDMYVAPFRIHASDWLDSCWNGDQWDWSRYGEVIRSIQQLQHALTHEILGLLGHSPDIPTDALDDVQAPSHLNAAHALGPFLDACLHTPIAQVEKVLGRAESVIPLSRDEVEASRARFEAMLRTSSEHLRQLAALALSSRSAQKRPAEDRSDIGSSSSVNKRARVSASPTVSERSLDELNGFTTPPPLSTAPSTTALSEAVVKPPVTIAMLRALAQGVLRPSK
ncbi:hypothetical protein BDW22DRAFT_1355768 [Trametopsis cervina]|nr:hypothetical protein BDW22DRAFT_1355768 [Trametopsis cervina]